MPQSCAYREGLQHMVPLTIGQVLQCTQFAYNYDPPGNRIQDQIIMAHAPGPRDCVPVEGRFFDRQRSQQYSNARFQYFDIQFLQNDQVFSHPGTSVCKQVAFPQIVEQSAQAHTKPAPPPDF